MYKTIDSQMPSGYWGEWRLERSTELFKVGDVTILDCWAAEFVQDESGVAAPRTIEHDPCARHLVVARAEDGGLIWSRVLGSQFDKTTVHRDDSAVVFINENGVVRVNGQTGAEHKLELLYKAADFERVCCLIVEDFQEITNELIAYLAQHPQDLLKLHHRRFEELLEAIFRNQGYRTELGSGSGDGGVDLRLVQKDSIGEIVTLVQAKHYARHRPIALEAVSALYGVVQATHANRGLFVTTSRYLPSAHAFAQSLSSSLTLATAEDVARWCALATSRKIALDHDD